MATKTMTVLEDVTLELPISELASASIPSEWTVLSSRRNSLATWESITLLEPEKYRVALVSFQNSADAGLRTLILSQLLLVPLTWKEFVKRVRGGLNQSHALEENNIVQFGRVSIDLMSMEVRRSDRAVSLTAMQFKVLRFFVTNPKRVISRDRLLNEVWGYQSYPCTRTVDNHVLKLRQKLEPEPADPVHFQTVHGIGYKFIP
ncbi:MAG: hypothetical protein DMG95_13215 [Acidobacteria bacterium]|nr:MAG: hypothetical protein DMG95_13215 [Acidobacteriota bacterium]